MWRQWKPYANSATVFCENKINTQATYFAYLHLMKLRYLVAPAMMLPVR